LNSSKPLHKIRCFHKTLYAKYKLPYCILCRIQRLQVQSVQARGYLQ